MEIFFYGWRRMVLRRLLEFDDKHCELLQQVYGSMLLLPAMDVTAYYVLHKWR